MAEMNFVKVGHKQGQQFIEDAIQARQIIDSKGISVEVHQNNTGIHLTAEQTALIAGAIQAALLGVAGGVATLGPDGKLLASQLDLGKYATSANVATYEDMLALTTAQAKVNTFVFVADATGDETVKSGWAAYKRVAGNGDAADYVKVSEGESLDINIPELEQGITDAQQAAQAAQSTADTAVANAANAQETANTAVSNAAAAQDTADDAAAEAAKRDCAYCTSEADMQSKNLRDGALVFMAVEAD